MKYVLGIDLGTSGVKSVLYDSDGKIVSTASRTYPLIQPKNGWAEQNPNDWKNATLETLQDVSVAIDTKNMVGIGISGQMHGLVLLDKDNLPLMNSIIWCDNRTEKEVEQIITVIGKERYVEETLNAPNASITLSKLLWVKKNMPIVYSKINKVLLPKDYLNFCLTGQYATDVSDASGTGYFDVNNRAWSNFVLNKFDINREWLPNVYESTQVIGNIAEGIVQKYGLSPSTIVVAGAGDQAATGVGQGILKEGNVSISLGTSGVVFSALLAPKYDKLGRVHTYCHAVPNMWHIMGVTQACGLSISWFINNFCQNLGKSEKEIYSQLEEKSNNIGSDGIVYLPYLMGERTPHLDPKCRGLFAGLSASHNIYQLYKAVLEGVCFSIKDCFSLIKAMEVEINEIKVCGGGSKSNLWLEILANIIGDKLSVAYNSESGSLGVAMLAAVGAGLYDNLETANAKMIDSCNETVGIKTQATDYALTYKKYVKLYSATKDIME